MNLFLTFIDFAKERHVEKKKLLCHLVSHLGFASDARQSI